MTIQHFNTKLAAECREVTWRVLEIRKPRVLCPACEEVKHPENQWNISSCFIPQASTLAPSYLCPQRLRSRKSTLAKIVHRIAEFLRGYRYGQLTVEIASLSGWWTVGALVSASSVGALELDPTVGGWITTQFSVKLDHLTKSRLKDAKSISLIAANFWNDDLVDLDGPAPKWELLLELDPLPVLAISSVPNLSVPRLEVWFLFRLCSWKVVGSWRKCYQWQEEVQKSTHTLWTCLSNCFNT